MFSSKLFPTVTGKPSFNDADAEESAKSLRKAMQGFGTDEKRIIKELINHTNSQRQQIKERYHTLYGHTLEEDLKAELKGNFEDVVVALLEPRFQFEARCIRDAIKGAGTNERVVIDLLCSKEASEIEKLKEAYHQAYDSDLEKDIKSEEDGPIGRIFRSLASGDRPSGNSVDVNLAAEEAQQLYDAGEGKHLGTDEVEFVRILCSRSFSQLRATFDAYAKIAGREIEASIKRETGGDLEDALLAIVKSIKNTPAYFAERLRESMKGAGTRDNDIIRTVVSRSEVDMAQIRAEYKRLYDKDLAKDIKDELTGDYEEIVLALVGLN